MIHRDLKPANIKLRPDGRVKVLDFGLAKAIDTQLPSAHDAEANTSGLLASAQVSTALGTAAYMSPEQAQGRPVDQRCDVWAFGAVLYEMLAGRRAFQGRGIHDTLAAVLEQDVDWSALPAATPAAVRGFVVRCLDRDINRRPPDLRDARTLFEPAQNPVISRRLALSALGIGGAALAAAWYFRAGPQRGRGAVRLPFILPRESSVLLPATRQALALAPDGSQFVYVANLQLFRRSLAELIAHPIEGTDRFGSVHQPVFSPDGRSLAFWAEFDSTIKRVSLDGGAASTICESENPFGMSWAGDTLLLGQGRRGIWRVAATGGTPDQLFRVNDGDEAFGPHVLPDGAVLYTIATGIDWTRWDEARLVVQSPGTATPTTLYEGGADARYLPVTGHLVFARAGTLLAAGFDVLRRRITAPPVPVIEGVRRGSNRDTGVAHFSVSDTGRLIGSTSCWRKCQRRLAGHTGTPRNNRYEPRVV